jgi:hypothetical protein
MGKAGRWLKSILAGRKSGVRDKALRHQQQQGDATPLPAASSPREKRRWSFRRPATAPTKQEGKANNAAPSPLSSLEPSARELDQSEHAVAAAAAATEVARLTAADESHLSVSCCPVEEAAAVRIQATFRGYLVRKKNCDDDTTVTDLISDLTSATETQARKALCALRGLVKLQALVRGQLVRRQANATLRRMQALVDAQSRLRAQRARMLDADHATPPAAYQRRSPHHPIPMRRSSYVRPTRAHTCMTN